MYAYVDESGNTGDNLFDENQPLFITAGLITRANFDVLYGRQVRGLAKEINESVLHANQLGLGRLEQIAPGLLKILKRADARFFLSHVEKKYLATTKIIDPGFPRWLLPITENDTTMGIRPRIRP